MYRFLDVVFFLLHLALIGFNLIGWIWKRTRRVHLVVISLTMLSWFGLGLFCGFGYCPLTDWHWQVKERAGEMNLPASWVKYYVDAATGLDSDPLVVDAVVLVLGLAALGASIWVNAPKRAFPGVHRPS